jgi:hypothetical protein
MKDTVQQLQITVVPPAVLDVVWPKAAEMLGKAVKTTRPRYNVDSLRAELDRGGLVLWLVLDGTEPVAAFTTRIAAYPESRGLCMDWIGGERMREWLPLAQPLMEMYARDNGCTHLEGYGRKAWGRWLQKYGWEPEYTAYRMELTNG